MTLPAGLTRAVQDALASAGDPGEIVRVTPLSGGDINEAARVDTPKQPYLLKWSTQDRDEQFACEAEGLRLLRKTGCLAIPGVIAWRDEISPDSPAFLLEEYIQPAPGHPRWEAARLGAELAEHHRASAGQSAGRFGLDRDNYIGATRQTNDWTVDWIEFFRDQRLDFQVRLAHGHGRLSPIQSRQLGRLLERLDHWLGGHRAQPSLLHGDLWSGNVIAGSGGRAFLIDPAVYYGDREADLAFSELFGGFPQSFYRAYNETWPLEPGYEARRDVYNLYHLLNHLNIFGQSYSGSIDSILGYYVGRG